MGISRMFDREPLRVKERNTRRIALGRPESETHITERPDRVKGYLLDYTKEFIFDEFSPAYLKANNLQDEFGGVGIPLRKEDLQAFKTEKGLGAGILAENMARVIGVDPHFRYEKAYSAFVNRIFGRKAVDNLTRKAKDLADQELYAEACLYFRAALVLKFDDIAAMYGYARVLRALYNNSTDEAYVGNLKAESLEYLELLTEFYPNFDSGWYYLGYMYLNLGLYAKAKIAWERYLLKSKTAKDRREIQKRLEQIAVPVEIEKGYNAVLSGKWPEGIDILEPYRESVYRDWWPLWYYLGVAYARTDREDDAITAFKASLKGNPRHIEAIGELVELYTARGDKENIKKYKGKIALIEKDDLARQRAKEGLLSIAR
ncbi:MAG: hypothetical protein LBS85_02580 [Clostridiales Family XIII bacterium]|jgi:tetratricopeptide (TPR) repeat protein|nr:hypothetical protein [Clostridiales Family XIII bacterium]